MPFSEIELKVKMWADQRGLIDGHPGGQLNKLREEFHETGTRGLGWWDDPASGEWKEGHGTIDDKEFLDGLGDMMVVMEVMLTRWNRLQPVEAQRYTLEDCFRMAYNEIKDRTGKLNDKGEFVKD